MGIGKIAAQVAHAAVLGAERTKQFNQVWFHRWFESGQAKVVVKVQSYEELIVLRNIAENLSLTESIGPPRANWAFSDTPFPTPTLASRN